MSSLSPSDAPRGAGALAFVAGLADGGVGHLVVSPGSRSTALVWAAAQEARLALHVAVDERAAAFMALGMARESGKPAAVLCTSGTAGAHYHPAVAEARAAAVPLVAVTADRPWELQHGGALQTMDQGRLFGVHAKLSLTLGEDADARPDAARKVGATAAAAARSPLPGPVHVNAAFRKPLEPAEPSLASPLSSNPRRVTVGSRRAPREDARALLDRLRAAERPLFVVGPRPPSVDDDAILRLAEALGVPCAAEVTSQLRFRGSRPGGPGGLGVLLDVGLDAFFDDLAEPTPDLILEWGATPTSAAYERWLSRRSFRERVVVAERVDVDPTATASWTFHVDGDGLATDLLALEGRVADRPSGPAGHWLEHLRQRAGALRARMEESLTQRGFTGSIVARAVLEGAPAKAAILVGNGTPIRDLDACAPVTTTALRVVHQRGVSGIDGFLAQSAGLRAVATDAVLCLMGDVAFAHDVGSLSLLRQGDGQRGGPCVVVVVRNGGGRIFDRLPAATHPATAPLFPRFFLTDPELDVADVARSFGVASRRVSSRDDLASAIEDGLSSRRALVVEAAVIEGAP